jgi:hypothetical protein
MPVGAAIEYDARHWLADLQEVVGDHQARDSIMCAYEDGTISADDAFEALAERRLFGKVSTFMEAFLIGYRTIMARAIYIDMPFPEHDSDIPPRTMAELISAIKNQCGRTEEVLADDELPAPMCWPDTLNSLAAAREERS